MSRLTPPVNSGDHILGDPGALVTLVEYGDYECPFCRSAHLVVQTVLPRLGNQVRYVFRHFPLTQLHPRALPAALATEAAAAQGKLWSMHATLFEHQTALEDEDLLGYAEALGLDLRRFASDMQNQTGLAKVRNDFRSGVRIGVSGTPTFFIDGYRFDGRWDDPALLIAALRIAASERHLHR
ncbi:MAG: DsbA family protein [Polyangiaceae bacterium]